MHSGTIQSISNKASSVRSLLRMILLNRKKNKRKGIMASGGRPLSTGLNCKPVVESGSCEFNFYSSNEGTDY
jgi:hypothetical protein